MTATRVNVELDAATIPWTAADLTATFDWLLQEMRSVGKVLRPDERDALRRIMDHTGAPLTVRELFPAFAREDEGHKTLRRLRATQFVYPKRTGRWEPDEPIAVTPFARVMWDHLGETRIFAFPPVKSKRVPIDAPTPAPVQPVVTWDNLVDHIRERQQTLAGSAPNPGS